MYWSAYWLGESRVGMKVGERARTSGLQYTGLFHESGVDWRTGATLGGRGGRGICPPEEAMLSAKAFHAGRLVCLVSSPFQSGLTFVQKHWGSRRRFRSCYDPCTAVRMPCPTLKHWKRARLLPMESRPQSQLLGSYLAWMRDPLKFPPQDYCRTQEESDMPGDVSK